MVLNQYRKGVITLSERYALIAEVGKAREQSLFNEVDDIAPIMLEWWRHVETL